MKKLAITLSLVLALVIAAAVSLPALAEDIGSTTLKVSIPAGMIEVTAPTGDVEMGQGTPETPATNTPALEVTVSSNGNWELTVEDRRDPPATKGFMDNGATPTPVTLGLPTEVKGGLVSDWASLEADQTLKTGSAGTVTVDDIYFQQQVEYTDPAGDYQITVTFAANVIP